MENGQRRRDAASQKDRRGNDDGEERERRDPSHKLRVTQQEGGDRQLDGAPGDEAFFHDVFGAVGFGVAAEEVGVGAEGSGELEGLAVEAGDPGEDGVGEFGFGEFGAGFEFGGEADGVVAFDPHEAVVEDFGMEWVEAEGVSGVEAVGEVEARGDDVAGDEEFGLAEAGDGAAGFVGGEDAEAEEIADDADADDGVAAGPGGGRSEVGMWATCSMGWPRRWARSRVLS